MEHGCVGVSACVGADIVCFIHSLIVWLSWYVWSLFHRVVFFVVWLCFVNQ